MYLRKGNLRFDVKQNNADKSLLISEFKHTVDKRDDGDYFGFSNVDLQGKDIRTLLPVDIDEILDENIEYESDGNDFKAVVEKIINFKILNKAKVPLDMNAHVERDISDYENLKVGRARMDEILRKTAYAIKTTFRLRDIPSYMGVGHFAVTMVKTYPDEVVHPLKRLQSSLRKEGILTSSISINARFKEIDLGLEVDEVISKIKTKSIDVTLKARNDK